MQRHKFGARYKIVSHFTGLNTNLRGQELESLIVDTVSALFINKDDSDYSVWKTS